MKKHANIDFNICNPEICSNNTGCFASDSCSHNLIEQEEDNNCPMLLSVSMCSACGKCVKACPLNAIKITTGVY